MENLSEYIPLIIIIGSIIYSVLRGAGKKNEEKTVQTTLPSYEPAKPIEVPEIFPQENPFYQMKEKDKKVKTRKIELNPEVQRSVVPSSPSSHSILEQEIEKSERIVLDVADVDEVRKAFIYSEILNRKEY
jgi:hypothetical protein